MRVNAKKVLLVFTDKSSGLDEKTLRSAAAELENEEVEIIAVSIGDESSSRELAFVTPHTGNIIDAPTDENPDKLSSEILNLIITGLCACCYAVLGQGPQHGRVVRALDLKSGGRGFKSRSGH